MKTTLHHSRAKKGFTLTELLTTVATIGVVASLLLPAVTKVKHRARDVQCLNNQRSTHILIDSLYQDVTTDYNLRYTKEDFEDIYQGLIDSTKGTLIKDPYLGDIGVYTARNLTCPYAFGDGTKRSGFGIFITKNDEDDLSSQSIPYTPPGNSDVKYVTFTYQMRWQPTETEFNGPHAKETPVVADVFNESTPYTMPSLFLFTESKVQNRNIVFDESLAHAHKGIGRYGTFLDNSQRWIKK